MKTAPLASFKNLQTIILPYPYTTTPISLNALGNQGIDVHMQLLTLPASLLKHSNNINGGIPSTIRAFDDIIYPERETTLSDGTRLQVSGSKVRWYSRLRWERVWAWML
jgi:hypothetical protein